MLETAVWGAYYNVKTNLDDVKDEEFKKKVRYLYLGKQSTQVRYIWNKITESRFEKRRIKINLRVC